MNKPLRTIILLVLALVVVGAGAYAFYAKKALSPEVAGEPVATSGQDYENAAHGFGFSYPDGFTLTEKEVGDAHRGHYQVMLVRNEDATPPEGGEGPVAVTIDVYQNDIDQQPLMNWITTTNIANYKLGDGTLVESKVGGQEAQTNTWSGLYEGKTTTFAHHDHIIAVSVTWMTQEDETLDAYEEVLRTFAFPDETAIPQ